MELAAGRMRCDWGSLPSDLLGQVLGWLASHRTASLRLTCKHWKQCADVSLAWLRCNRTEEVPAGRLVALFPNLTSLDLSCDWVSCSALFDDVTSGVQSLRGLKALRRLSLDGWSGLRDEHTVWIGKLDTLRDLDLTFCSTLTDVGMLYIGELVQLTSLKLTGCSFLTNDGFEFLSPLASLEVLSVSGTNLGDRALNNLLPSLKSLRDLDLMECSNVSDWGVQCVLTTVNKLEALDLTECSAISDKGLSVLVEMESKLKRLRLEGCDKVSIEFICSLEALTDITVHTSDNTLVSEASSLASAEMELFTGMEKSLLDDGSSDDNSDACSYSSSRGGCKGGGSGAWKGT